MKKVLHVHSDYKFIIDTDRYYGDYFDNQILILDTKNSNNTEHHNNAQFIDADPKNLNEIVAIANTSDLIVLYNLDFFKSQIVNQVNKNVKVVWRFFGSELYSRKLQLYLSTKSRSLFANRIFKERIKSIFPFLFKEERSFYKAARRADAIVCVFREEYEYLTKHYRNLPKFIPLSLDDIPYAEELDFESDFPKKDIVVIGNSRSSYNNHLDILDLIKTTKLDNRINIKILFNYGVEDAYTDKVREKANNIEQATLIDSFLPPDEFKNFYGPVAATVNNGYRQFALGNIMMALHKGVKVYLNKKNATYTWFKKEGLLIYEIADLKKDLESGQLHLSKSEIEHNLKCFKKLKDLYTKTDFQIQIMQLLNK